MELIRNKQTASLIIVLCFLAIIAVGRVSAKKEKAIHEICQNLQSDLQKISFSGVLDGIEAQSVIVRNISTNTDYITKDTETPRPLASITKLMTVRVVLQQKVPLDSLYTLTDKDTAPYGTVPGLASGAQFTIRDLMKASLVSSSNDAAEALMYSTGIQNPSSFFESMTKEAKDSGWSSFQFSGATGLDLEGKPTALGSARDVAELLSVSVQQFPEVFVFPQRQLSITSRSGEVIILPTTNEAIPDLPLLIAGKTGYTLTAGGNLAVLWQHPVKNEERITAVVLGSTFKGRFSDITKLYSVVNSYAQYEQSLLAVCHNL